MKLILIVLRIMRSRILSWYSFNKEDQDEIKFMLK
jgi:hypothetical protein